MRGNEPDALPAWMPRLGRRLQKTCARLPANWTTARTCGMESCCPIIWLSHTISGWVCANASGYSVRWDFGGASRGPSSRRLIPPRKRLLKKLAVLATDSTLDLWSADECHFQQHGSRCTMWVPPE